uniref:restriction endonuclease subunit S n=1 Tax=Roseovarius sp. BRH_c41 TaxID=1629709 RepID=UPI000AE0EFDF|nr:restriction endonuclease subunit S [Roseovarius sp. BRH_c41]
MKDTPLTAARLLALYDQVAGAEDAIPRLRRFVLDLAVRGKLVPQDAGEHVPAERVAAPKGATPYDLPSNWRWMQIGDQLDLLNGMAFKPTDWKTTGLRIVRIQNLNNESAPFNFCDPEMARDRSIIDDGSFLISWSGTPGTSFGAFIWNRGRAVLNQHIFRCDFKTPAFDQAYLRLAINGRLDEMIAKAHGGVGLQHITKGKLESMLIALPPLAEQRRIVGRVEELMALCDQLQAARAGERAVRDRLTTATLSRLTDPDQSAEAAPQNARFALHSLPTLTTHPAQIKTLRQTILNLAVRGKLVEQDPTDEPAAELLKRIAIERNVAAKAKKVRRNGVQEVSSLSSDVPLPDGWLWTDVDEIALSMRYGTSTKCEYATKGVPVLRIPNVSGGQISLADMKFGPLSPSEISDLALSAGDILMIRSNGSLDIVGRSAVVTPEATGMAFAGYLVRLRLSSANLSATYLWLVLNSSDIRNQIEKPIRSAVGLKNVNLTEFGALTIPLPPLAEQHRIVARVDALMALCDQLESSLTTATTTRSRLLEALLHEALNGALGAQAEAAA